MSTRGRSGACANGISTHEQNVAERNRTAPTEPPPQDRLSVEPSVWTVSDRSSSSLTGILIVTTSGVSYHMAPSSSKPGTLSSHFIVDSPDGLVELARSDYLAFPVAPGAWNSPEDLGARKGAVSNFYAWARAASRQRQRRHKMMSTFVSRAVVCS